MAAVLLIDDNQEFIDLMRMGLEKLGHKVETASDGDEGLRVFRSRTFDIVVTDIIMPGREGLETILEIKRISPDKPVIAMSGGMIGKTAFLDVAKKLGAVEALQKPFKIAHLHELILAHTQSPQADRKGKHGTR